MSRRAAPPLSPLGQGEDRGRLHFFTGASLLPPHRAEWPRLLANRGGAARKGRVASVACQPRWRSHKRLRKTPSIDSRRRSELRDSCSRCEPRLTSNLGHPPEKAGWPRLLVNRGGAATRDSERHHQSTADDVPNSGTRVRGANPDWRAIWATRHKRPGGLGCLSTEVAQPQETPKDTIHRQPTTFQTPGLVFAVRTQIGEQSGPPARIGRVASVACQPRWRSHKRLRKTPSIDSRRRSELRDSCSRCEPRLTSNLGHPPEKAGWPRLLVNRGGEATRDSGRRHPSTADDVPNSGTRVRGANPD
ncbi:hypothetical protein Pan216_56810 [Planctomycetes bacterium Pan216]|uniref:Uncharacterized protein n=1 Tax=Kolteria novifilia TaxID=2527975 RepID=A0A518BCV4_9BACT|nr:hypothetical protein Pan216_56810 [Planctomycetes bacterium Pan216]